MRIKTTSLIALAVFPREEIVDIKSLFVSETTFVIKWSLPIEFSINTHTLNQTVSREIVTEIIFCKSSLARFI